MIIREVKPDDANHLLYLYLKLDNETKFMLYEPGERKVHIDHLQQTIDEFVNDESRVLLVAVDDVLDKFIGFCAGIGNRLNRNKHTAYCIIGIEAMSTGKGIGVQLLNSLESWSLNRQIHRLELTVIEGNERAIKLYKKCGFETEGVKRNSMNIDGKYVNELYMSKLLYPKDTICN